MGQRSTYKTIPERLAHLREAGNYLYLCCVGRSIYKPFAQPGQCGNESAHWLASKQSAPCGIFNRWGCCLFNPYLYGLALCRAWNLNERNKAWPGPFTLLEIPW